MIQQIKLHHHHNGHEAHHEYCGGGYGDSNGATYLIKENYLNEFSTDRDKELVRRTLDLVSKSELELEVRDITKTIKYEPIWTPSGPVSTTVGFVEDNTEFTTPLTFQQLIDAIFYSRTSEKADVFIGLLSSADETVSLLKIDTLVNTDPVNNTYNYLGSSIIHDYEFSDPSLKYLVIVTPSNYPPLESISVGSQKFGLNAFDFSQFETIDMEKGERKTYDVYVYKQGLSTLSTSVTFKFR